VAGITRRIAAIVSADAKGYSRLMASDDVGTLRTLTSHRAVMRAAIAAHRGRLVDDPGDNVLAEFASAVNAVQCAVVIQRSLAGRNEQLLTERRLEFRIGVNAGDVLARGARVYGDAVNVAARMEALADAGGICISGVVYDQVASRLDIRWEALGERTLKNIARAVRVYRARLERRPAAPLPAAAAHPASIAVLPFSALDAGSTASAMGEGIADDIIAALSALPDVCVVSRNATTQYRDAHDAAAVGRELGVRYVVSGTVRREASRLRVGIEVADAVTNAILSTRRIDGGADDVFGLHDRIAAAAVAMIAPHVRQAEIRTTLRPVVKGGAA
jgi:adenylate cyclase